MSEEDVYVEVLYDFSYNNEDGTEINMKEGEELLVVEKTNDDWWQVIRNSGKLPFFAPYCCLSIIPNSSNIKGFNNISNDINANYGNGVTSLSDVSLKSGDTSYDSVDVSENDKINELDESLSSLSPQYSLVFSSSWNTNEEQTNENQLSSLTISNSAYVLEETTGNSTKHKASISEDSPPKPSEIDVPQRHLPNDWLEYADVNGRKYYYHAISGKVTWKPPRRSDTLSDVNGTEPPILSKESSPVTIPKPPPKQLKPKLQKLTYSSTESLDSPTSSCMFTILPAGYVQECDSSGNVYYFNKISNKKWYSSQDENGRTYFYEDGSSESFWELPDISVSDLKDYVPPTTSYGSESSLEAISSTLSSSTPKSEHLASDDCSPKLRSKKAPKLPFPRQFKTRSMVVPESVSVNSLEEEKNSSCFLGCVINEGVLHKTKIVENGRRVRKNWSTSYVVLTDKILLFYKDQRSAHPISAMKSDFSIDLNGALIDWCPDKSSRKNVFQISTIYGHQLLLQHDDAQEIKDWFSAIQDAIIRLPSSLEHGGNSKENAEEHSKSIVKLSRSKSTKQCHCRTASNDSITISIPVEKKLKIRDKLRQFFVRRPTMESLREKGIILDEPVFGCCLENLCQRENSTVPKFVMKCVETIEKKELTADGLYRASGNLSQVQKIRFHVNQDDYKCLDEEEDVHVLTGALKLFFREMKEPLFPFEMFDKFLQAIALPDAQSKMKALKELVHKMPEPNYQTLRFLLQHLLRVTEFHKQNRMQKQNLAIVFGPTLLWPEEESANIALDMMHQNRIVEFLLLEFKSIFM